MNTKLWRILEKLDDISYSNLMIASTLNDLHSKPDNGLLYPKGMRNIKEQEFLLPLFQHKISAVRASLYQLEISLIKIVDNDTMNKNITHYRNVLKLAT